MFDVNIVFRTKENLTRARVDKNGSEIVIVYFYASNNPAFGKTSLQKLLAYIRALYTVCDEKFFFFRYARVYVEIKKSNKTPAGTLVKTKTLPLSRKERLRLFSV